MIKNICLLFEILSVVFCLHCLYNETLKFEIVTTSFLTIYMITMSAINYYKLPQVYSLIIYLLVAIYCGIRFGFKWKMLIINNVLYIVIIGGIQLLIATIYGYIFSVLHLRKIELLLINGAVFLVVFFLLPRLQIYRISIYLQDSERILIISLVFCIILVSYGIVKYKMIKGFEVYQYVPLFIGIVLFFILGGLLGKYKIKAKEIETELKMYHLYADSLQSLIDEIRSRQHEFDNHINTIYSLHYTCKTYEQLVNAQQEYGNEIVKENRHNKLLVSGNPLIIGFLYGKVVEIEKLGIGIYYQINIGGLNVGVPVYKLVEILGNLIKNAVEALMSSEINRELYILMMERDGAFKIEVRNKSNFINYCDIDSFFKKGYSRKGEKRGLGLYNVKNICNEYSLKICCENKEINDENWLQISVMNGKEFI